MNALKRIPAIRIQCLMVLNQGLKVLIQPSKLLNHLVKVLIQGVKTLNQDAKGPIQVGVYLSGIIVINQWGYRMV